MQRFVVVRYHEVGLKGRNAPFFKNRLLDNLRLACHGLGVERVRRGHAMALLTLSPQADWEQVKKRLGQVFGVARFSLAYRTPPTLPALEAAILEHLQGMAFSSFRVTAKREDKAFPLTSQEINRDLGAAIQARTGARVDLHHAEVDVAVDLLPRQAFFSLAWAPGPGGLPVGTGGLVTCLLSGGIDSPIAAYRLMKRGCQVSLVHFHGFPLVEGSSRYKAVELAQMLNQYQFHTRLYLVPFGHLQKEVILTTAPPYRVLLYRRLMLRIAEAVARREGAKALVTGDSLGQVASQTLDNLVVIDEAATMPVLRPLIGMNKQEIVDEARRVGTYETSIQPDEDCCRLFVPKHPATHGRLEEVHPLEAALDIPALVARGLEGLEVKEFYTPGAEPARAREAGGASPAFLDRARQPD